MIFEPDGEGTRLTIEGQADIGGYPKLAEGLVGEYVEWLIEAGYHGLKHS